MGYVYDADNIFAKILRGEIPNDTVVETEHALAFNDIAPQAPVHVLVIPKGPFVNWDHFVTAAAAEEIAGFARALHQVIEKLGLEPGVGGQGYRLIMNAGEAGVQDVQHLHAHILSGRVLGPLIERA
ncbi:MAG: histidine triad nucleotide-binding protein [Rhodobacterales bacterium CG2_30_65_12]|nr:MAG: histidine triad nucleotide-binding protein [Rhodobacterales bacterium CG2_30_65_12]